MIRKIHSQWNPEGWYKLPEGWLWVPISPETWKLICENGNIEKTLDECLKELIKDPFTTSLNNPNNPARKVAEAHMDKCLMKFQEEKPCPSCGSHNTDIDLGTPMFCKDCGYEWT